MNVALGTVQFGLDYGISNQRGRIPESEAYALLDLAVARGVRLFDTAAAYGESESLLGRWLARRGAELGVMTKLAPSPAGASVDEAFALLTRRLEQSFEALGRPLEAILAHRSADFKGPLGERLWPWLNVQRDSGKVRRLGVSIYEEEELADLPPVDLVQLPLSILDQRPLATGLLARLQARGIEVHARSLFLQGALLMPPESLPAYLAPLANHLRACRERWNARGLRPLDAALQFAAQTSEVKYGVVGATTAAELDEICASLGAAAGRVEDFTRDAFPDHAYLNPSAWPALKESHR